MKKYYFLILSCVFLGLGSSVYASYSPHGDFQNQYILNKNVPSCIEYKVGFVDNDVLMTVSNNCSNDIYIKELEQDIIIPVGKSHEVNHQEVGVLNIQAKIKNEYTPLFKQRKINKQWRLLIGVLSVATILIGGRLILMLQTLFGRKKKETIS